MSDTQVNWITGYIWGIADEVLRDDYVRGKYRDIILPMTVLRRVEYEPDADLRDTERISLQEEESIEGFLKREVLPHAPDTWYLPDRAKIDYEISFTRYFYKPQPMRTLGRDTH